MTARLISSTPSAPWLPAGSIAEVWAGSGCTGYRPAIIVRLLLRNGHKFFTVASEKGDDLPTLFLGPGADRLSPEDGLQRLLRTVVGRTDVPTTCVGFVRNVVPEPDQAYPHPVPHAHVPVFETLESIQPVVPGRWHTIESAEADLADRHWWPIVTDASVR